MIQEFVSTICEILNICIPFISYDTSNFQSDTMMAQCSQDGSTIYLKKYDKPNPDQLFSIAHELRHIWQIKYHHDLYFYNYIIPPFRWFFNLFFNFLTISVVF